MTQTAFTWGEPVEIGRGKYGSRKAQIAALRPGDPVILGSASLARSFQSIARRSLGLRSTRRKIAGVRQWEFIVQGPQP